MTLKELRIQSGKTVKEVAEALSVKEQTVYRYENGERTINIGQVLVLSRLYKEKAEDIILAQFNSPKVR